MQKLYLLLFILVIAACTKETRKSNLIEDNVPPPPGTVSTMKVRNYVNRLYIDLLGRTPTDTEKNIETQKLQDAALSFEAREDLIIRLQTDTTFVEGDSSYKNAYYNRIYELCKSRLLEGAGDDIFSQQIGILNFGITVARLEGDSVRVFRNLENIKRYRNVIESRIALREGIITLNQMFARMLNNGVYDEINMNTFNFINASFDDLYDRFPTQKEFDAAFPIIESNLGGVFMGEYIDNKTDYCQIMTESNAFYEGLIKWTYMNLLGRPATSNELYNRLKEFVQHKNYQTIQIKILRSNEYAQF
jgi:hypothetical protein